MELKAGYKQTEVGVIPEDWDVQPLLKAVHIANGQVSPKHEPYKSMILVAPDHIESSTGKLLSKKTAADQGAISGKYMFESGDIVYSKIRPYLRKAILADFSGLCSADMYPLKPAPWASGGYILAVILGHQFTRYAESVSVRSGMPKINRAEMADFTIAVPPLPEQLAIGSVLADIDRLIRDLEFLIAKKRDIKQAAMQELLTGTRWLPGFEGEWVAGKLGDYVEKIVGGGTPSRANQGFWGGEIPWATVKDLTSFQPNQTQEWLTRDGLKKSSANLIPAGTLIASTRMALGKAVIFGTDVAINQDLKAIFFGKNGMARFFCYWFEANASAIDAIGGGSTVKGISLSQLKAIDVASPGLAEQNAIVDVISDIETEIETLENRLTKTRAIKQAMMQELLTGRIRLR